MCNFSKFILAIAMALAIGSPAFGQSPSDQIEIGQDGIMRWRKDGSEVTGFGVNYTAPFAHAYRSAKRMGIDVKKAIDEDLYHFKRLGLDLYRVHVWDTEISDSLGNLLDNEHLEVFDYLLAQLKAHDIHAIITPIAYWGNGWPEPDEPTPGFSAKYGKDNCLVDPAAIKAQANYLAQFVNHINRYTGTAYKDESSILAFEVCNEPHHRGTPEEVTAFVKLMKEAIGTTGCTKPVFYNVSHSIHRAEAYYAAGIDGGTFQWYPTGLGFQQELGGNMLPNVDRYPIPFDDVLKKNGSARIVYEFDAADMASTYMYPAMARSFRTAGMQLATHFAYDPTFYAAYNTEYNTHFMNLVYAPRKALSLMICGEIFRHIPLYTDYGHYPNNTSFGNFHISYEDDLAEMATTRKFIYTNNTATIPPDPDKLEHIAGWGNSPIVEYDGTGAYFLDKISEGVWSLEIFPDALITDNPFGRNSPDKRRAEISSGAHTMTIHLPWLNHNYIIASPDLATQFEYSKRTFPIKPGAYLIIHARVDPPEQQVVLKYVEDHQFGAFTTTALNQGLTKTMIVHHPTATCIAGRDMEIKANVISPVPIDSVVVWYYDGWKLETMRMDETNGSTYKAIIPGKALHLENKFRYYITVHHAGLIRTYPSGRTVQPGAWNFDASEAYVTQCLEPSYPIVLFDASTDANRLNREWLPGSRIEPGLLPGDDQLYLKTEQLLHTDPENPDGEKIADYSVRHFFGDLIVNRKVDLEKQQELVIEATSGSDKPCPVQFALVMDDGSAFGTILKLKSGKGLYRISLEKLEKVQAVILPRPYPTFLPYYAIAGNAQLFDIRRIESLQISIGPGLKKEEVNEEHAVRIGKIYLD